MSRFRHIIEKDGYLYEVCYGYDEPLMEYFLQVYCFAGNPKYKWDDDGLLFSVSSYNTLKPHPATPDKTTYSNSQMYELMKSWGVPKLPLEKVAMDLKF